MWRGERGRKTPSAITGYDAMPGYQAGTELVRELLRTGRRMRGNDFGLDQLLAEKAARTLLATAEAGARLEPLRRRRFYQCAWLGTHACTGILRCARKLRLIPAEAGLAEDAVIRRAQQEVTIAMGVMSRRSRRAAD